MIRGSPWSQRVVRGQRVALSKFASWAATMSLGHDGGNTRVFLRCQGNHVLVVAFVLTIFHIQVVTLPCQLSTRSGGARCCLAAQPCQVFFGFIRVLSCRFAIVCSRTLSVDDIEVLCFL